MTGEKTNMNDSNTNVIGVNVPSQISWLISRMIRLLMAPFFLLGGAIVLISLKVAPLKPDAFCCGPSDEHIEGPGSI